MRNGLEETDPLLAQFCTSLTPTPTITTAPAAFIKFHSDAATTASGFSASWSSQPGNIGLYEKH